MKTGRIFIYAILVVLSFVMLLPLFWMVSTALKDLPQIHAYPPRWIPWPIHFENFKTSLTKFPFWLYLNNTLIITVLNIAGVLFSTMLVAYGFARLHSPLSNVMFGLMLSTMLLPAQVTGIPVFILFQKLGWYDTWFPLIVPSLFGGAFNIFLMRQFFKTIPQDLVDAARLDGCSEWSILWRIFVPLSKPVILVVTLFTFLGSWNDFFGPLIYLNDSKKYTLAVGLNSLINNVWSPEGAHWEWMMSASLLVMLPVIVLFFFAQRYFIEGIKLTGLKG